MLVPHKRWVNLEIEEEVNKKSNKVWEECIIPLSRKHDQYKNHTFEDSVQRGSISSDLSSISVKGDDQHKYKPVKKKRQQTRQLVNDCYTWISLPSLVTSRWSPVVGLPALEK